MPLDKVWEDELDVLGVLQGLVEPTSTTPLDAEGIMDLEARILNEIITRVAAAVPSGSGAPTGGNLVGFYEDTSTTPSTLYFDGRAVTVATVAGTPTPTPNPGGGPPSGGGGGTPTNTSPTVELSNAGISGLADGAAIASWTGTEGTVFSQSVGADKPIKQTRGGFAVARFAGGADSLYSDAPPTGFMSNVDAGTIVVVKYTTTNPTSNQGVAAISTGAATGNSRLALQEGATSGKHGMSSRRLDADSLEGPYSESSTSVGVNAWEVCIAEANYLLGTRKLWINGTQVVDQTITGANVFPSTTSKDVFTRADGALGADWTTISWWGGSGPLVSSNAVVPLTGGYFSFAYYNVATYGSDSEVYEDITTTSTGWDAAVALRMTSDGTFAGFNCYWAQASDNQLLIGSIVGGNSTTLTSASVAWAAGDKIGFRAVGSTLSVYRYTAGAWIQTPVATVTDTSLTTAGYIGLWVEDGGAGTAKIDNFSGGTYVPAGGGNTGNTSTTGALRLALGNFSALSAGFVGDVYAAIYYNRALTSAQRDFLTSTYLTALGANTGGSSGGSGSGGGAVDGAHGTVAFNSDFSAGAISSSQWVIGNPDQAAGVPWYNTNANNVYIFNDPTIGTVCRLQANYSNGQITTAGMINSKNKYTVAPPASSDSVLLECIMRTPNVQGAWPTFWAWNLSNTANEWDVVEIFGRPWEITATYHAYTSYSDYEYRQVSATPYNGLHSFAMRITTTQVIAYYDRVQIGAVMTNRDTFSNMHLIASLQGLSQSGQPWANSDQWLIGSGTFYQDIKRITVWRGGTGPPPA